MATSFTGLGAAELDRLRERLTEIGYTVDGVLDRLGEEANAALDRNETTPAERLTRSRGPLDTTIRLWLLQRPVARSALDNALPGLVDPLLAAGYLAADGDEVRAAVDVHPYGDDAHDWWVVADLTPGLDGSRPVVTADHVLGVNSAATTLAELTVPRLVDAALDLGSGCGLQSLHLSTQADRVVATDVNPRALTMTRQTARLNGVPVDVRAGSLFEPVANNRFDLVVSNPPFVVSPGTDRLVYRDSGLPGDEICRRFVREVPAHLAPGGVCQLLANWIHHRDHDWRDRIGSWVEGTGCDAWVIEREVSDPAAYVEIWLKDAGWHGAPDYTERYDRWLSWLTEQRAEGIGFGWILLRNVGDEATAHRRIEAWPHSVEPPLGPTIARWLDRTDRMRGHTDDVLATARPVLADDVEQEQVGRPGREHPERIVLRQRRGLRRAVAVDTAQAGFAGACDGSMTVDQIVSALATLLDEDLADLRQRLMSWVRERIDDGFFDLAPS